MVFKKTMYRLGKGENFHGVFDGEGFLLYYLSSEPSGIVVKCKEIKRRAGYLETTLQDQTIEAREVVPLENLLVASRGERQVKMMQK